MKKNGFVISTMLYSIFGIMIIIVFYILYLLVSNKSLLISSIDEIKNNLEITNTEEKIYIHFAVSDYLKDKYSNDFFQGIKLKVEEQLKQETNNTYIIDIGSEYTTLSEEKTSGISYEYSILNSHSEGSRYMNYHGSFGNYVIITETGSSRGGDKYNGYYVNGNMRAFLVNVLDPSEKISIIDSDFGPYHNDYRYMYVSIDKKNNYIYVKGMTEDETLVVSSSSGVYNGINFSINYSKSKYDPEDFSIINTENAYVYTSGTGKNIKFSYTANFNQIHNEWYTLNGALSSNMAACAALS